ncbi:hypothetical protein [Opitutus terrae]|uniref:Uncharacterized protein n=1 Tax=Opitutus terrae (strain DSM 11246 / JCM 15787 / PB90-1) TaxID=452637 RepID=B1ZPN0_OPITP|nr:hypothetical protein [Opitutus terrae]ACB74549.1 hypothetical protein Oter_1264 [Opitutus terrae PB90-1]
MPYSRRRPRIPATGRITVKLTPAQRDLFLQSSTTPRRLGYALHRAVVREGRLAVRVDREGLDTLIAVGARLPAPDHPSLRALETLLRYLESLADRFEDSADAESEPASPR